MGMAVLLVMVAFGTLVFRVDWGPFGYFLLLGVVASFWTAAFFALFHALVRNRNQAGALGAPDHPGLQPVRRLDDEPGDRCRRPSGRSGS